MRQATGNKRGVALSPHTLLLSDQRHARCKKQGTDACRARRTPDEALSLGTMRPGAFVKSFKNGILFVDQQSRCSSALDFIEAGHASFRAANN